MLVVGANAGSPGRDQTRGRKKAKSGPHEHKKKGQERDAAVEASNVLGKRSTNWVRVSQNARYSQDVRVYNLLSRSAPRGELRGYREQGILIGLSRKKGKGEVKR